jgi:hypothetical protein
VEAWGCWAAHQQHKQPKEDDDEEVQRQILGPMYHLVRRRSSGADKLVALAPYCLGFVVVFVGTLVNPWGD